MDAEHHPGDLDLIIRGIDREATDLYRDWKYSLHRAYRNNTRRYFEGETAIAQSCPYHGPVTVDLWPIWVRGVQGQWYFNSYLFFAFHILYTQIFFCWHLVCMLLVKSNALRPTLKTGSRWSFLVHRGYILLHKLGTGR